jgi:hypothetical protein
MMAKAADYSWLYLAGAAAAFYMWQKNKAPAVTLPAVDPNAQPVGLVQNTPGGLPILSSPTAPLTPPASGTAAPLTPGVSWTPWGTVTPSNFGPTGTTAPATTETAPTVTPPASVGPVAISVAGSAEPLNAERFRKVVLRLTISPAGGYVVTAAAEGLSALYPGIFASGNPDAGYTASYWVPENDPGRYVTINVTGTTGQTGTTRVFVKVVNGSVQISG